jgi:gamma-glutamylputrescine oxidase
MSVEATLPVWEDGAASALPELREDVSADVCVVGLGGSGLSAVHELLALGASVVGIDAGAVGCSAAGRNGGFLLAGTAPFYHDAVEAYGRERARRIYHATLDEIDLLERMMPGRVRRAGSLRIAADAEELADCEMQLAAMRADRLPVEAYEGPEGTGLLFPRDAAFQPLVRCRVMAERASDRGAQLFESSRAECISTGDVRTPAGRIRCNRVIVAVDGRLEALLPELGDRVRTARLQMLATEPANDVAYPRPVYYRWGFEYWQQLDDGRIALGGFRDRAGESEWTDSTVTTSAVQDMLEQFLRECVRTHARITHRWAAPIAFTQSGLPVCEEVRDGVIAIGGYSGLGNLIGGICGRIAARMAVGVDADNVFADG